MSTSTAIGFDMGATTTKTGVVKDGKIILRGEVIETRQDARGTSIARTGKKSVGPGYGPKGFEAELQRERKD